jgi:hypothetical protein
VFGSTTWAGGVLLLLIGVAIVLRTARGTGTAEGSSLIRAVRRVL